MHEPRVVAPPGGRVWDPAATWRLLQASSTDGTNRTDPAVDRAFWERNAAGYHADCLAARIPEIVERVLRHIEPGASVLELGAGTGGFTLPVARRASHVTALDHSPAMLRALAEQAARAGLANVARREADFEQADLEPHDVVLAANALYRVRDIGATLPRILAAARRRLLVVWSVGRAQPWERAARDLVAPGRYRPGPDYIHLVDALYELGHDAEVDLLPITYRREYADTEAALDALTCWPDPTPAERERCRALLPHLMEPLPTGGYRVPMRDRVAILRVETAP